MILAVRLMQTPAFGDVDTRESGRRYKTTLVASRADTMSVLAALGGHPVLRYDHPCICASVLAH
jgi:hypothetical protein